MDWSKRCDDEGENKQANASTIADIITSLK